MLKRKILKLKRRVIKQRVHKTFNNANAIQKLNRKPSQRQDKKRDVNSRNLKKRPCLKKRSLMEMAQKECKPKIQQSKSYKLSSTGKIRFYRSYWRVSGIKKQA